MAHTPIGEIASGFSHLLDPKRRAIVVLKAYFDDSGTHAGSKVVVWAGFMASSDEWAQFEVDCAALFKTHHISHFHAVEVEHNMGEFRDRRHWNEARRDLLGGDFRRLIAARNIIGIGAAVRVDAWEKIATQGMIARFVNPIYLAFEHCMQITLHWAEQATIQQTGVVEKVAFFFDSREGEAARCHDIASNFDGRWTRSEWYEGLSFVKMRSTFPLQAADMLAYETYQLEAARILTKGESKLRHHLEWMLRDIPIHGQYYDEDALTTLRDMVVAKDGPVNLLAPQGGPFEV